MDGVGKGHQMKGIWIRNFKRHVNLAILLPITKFAKLRCSSDNKVSSVNQLNSHHTAELLRWWGLDVRSSPSFKLQWRTFKAATQCPTEYIPNASLELCKCCKRPILWLDHDHAHLYFNFVNAYCKKYYLHNTFYDNIMVWSHLSKNYSSKVHEILVSWNACKYQRREF